MRLSEGRVEQVYEVTSMRWVTDEGKKHFMERGIKKGTLIYILEFTTYGYFLCNLLEPNNKQQKIGISFADAGIIEVKEATIQ